jgi:hypothetical protein
MIVTILDSALAELQHPKKNSTPSYLPPHFTLPLLSVSIPYRALESAVETITIMTMIFDKIPATIAICSLTRW